jgi:hypothetical protein
MPKKLNVKKLLKANPSVDPTRLVEVLKVVQELKKTGVIVTAGYDLTLPFSKRVSQVDENRQIGRLPRRS